MKSRLKPLAVALRQRQTEAETKIWFSLRDRRLCGAKFRRQVPIGPYIADFVCKEVNLIIELDGGQHSTEVDQARDHWLRAEGFHILRFWNNDIMLNLNGVLETVASALNPSPASGRRHGQGGTQ